MTFRPSFGRGLLIAGVGVAFAAIPAFAAGIPMLGRVAGWLMILGVAALPVALLRGRIVVGDDQVSVRSLTKTVTLHKGRCSARKFPVRRGLVGTRDTIALAGEDGVSTVIVLENYKASERATLRAALKHALDVHV